MTSTLLLTLTERALNEMPNRANIPGLPDAPAPFDKPFSSYDLVAAVRRHLRDNVGFTVILGYPDGAGTFSSVSTARTWERAVVDVAEEMLTNEAVGIADSLTIIDVMEGREHSTFYDANLYATVKFRDDGSAVLSTETNDQEVGAP